MLAVARGAILSAWLITACEEALEVASDDDDGAALDSDDATSLDEEADELIEDTLDAIFCDEEVAEAITEEIAEDKLDCDDSETFEDSEDCEDSEACEDSDEASEEDNGRLLALLPGTTITLELCALDSLDWPPALAILLATKLVAAELSLTRLEEDTTGRLLNSLELTLTALEEVIALGELVPGNWLPLPPPPHALSVNSEQASTAISIVWRSFV